MIGSFYKIDVASPIENGLWQPVVSQGFAEGELVLALTDAALAYF